MAGLLDDVLSPEVRALLGGPSGGLLGGNTGGAGGGPLGTDVQKIMAGELLRPRFQPSPNEGWADQLFGTNDPRDPRGPAFLAFASGLANRDIPGAMLAHQRSMEEREDRELRRAANSMLLGKGALEMQGLIDTGKRNRGIRGDLDKLYQGQQEPQPSRPDPQPLDSFGVPSIGGVPMFSQSPGPQFGGVPMLPAPTVPGLSGGYPPSAAPAGVPQRAAMGENLSKRLLQEAQVYARWGDYEQAGKLYEQAAKWQPSVQEIGVAMRDGKPVQVITYKDGRQQVTDFGPAPKTHWVDRGDAVEAVDEYTMERRGEPFRKGMTPSDRISAGNLQVSRERLALERDAPQYMQTDGGLIALPRRPGAGPITGRAVTGEDGQPIRPPLKPIPATANAAIVANAQNLKRAQDALTLVQGGEVGGAKGDKNATGWKGFAPNTLLNITDPEGVETRGAIADLGSMVIHDRSGAAVTAAEFPRLAPFIPRATDDPPTVEKKLKRFVEIYQQEAQALGEIYSRDQGYRPSPVLQRNRNPAADDPQESGGAKALPLPSNPTPSSLKTGQLYTLPNGKTAKWDGFAFRVQKQ